MAVAQVVRVLKELVKLNVVFRKRYRHLTKFRENASTDYKQVEKDVVRYMAGSDYSECEEAAMGAYTNIMKNLVTTAYGGYYGGPLSSIDREKLTGCGDVIVAKVDEAITNDFIDCDPILMDVIDMCMGSLPSYMHNDETLTYNDFLDPSEYQKSLMWRCLKTEHDLEKMAPGALFYFNTMDLINSIQDSGEDFDVALERYVHFIGGLKKDFDLAEYSRGVPLSSCEFSLAKWNDSQFKEGGYILIDMVERFKTYEEYKEWRYAVQLELRALEGITGWCVEFFKDWLDNTEKDEVSIRSAALHISACFLRQSSAGMNLH